MSDEPSTLSVEDIVNFPPHSLPTRTVIMPWFVKGEDVQKLYKDRIEGFFQRLQIPSPIHFYTTDALDKLFEWAKNVYTDNIRLQQEHHDATQENRDLRHELQQRIKELGDTGASLRQMTNDKEKYKGDFRDLSKKYNQDIDALLFQHGEAVETLKREHSKKVQELRNGYENELDQKEVELQVQKDQYEKELEDRTQKHNTEFDKLLGQVLTNTDDSTEWPDDKLKKNFGELKRLIDAITSPRKKEFMLSKKDLVGQNLDPTGFIRRGGYPHLLLKNAVWTVLVEQFFAIPFGFAAFGPGKGQDELFTMFGSWRKLFDNSISC